MIVKYHPVMRRYDLLAWRPTQLCSVRVSSDRSGSGYVGSGWLLDHRAIATRALGFVKGAVAARDQGFGGFTHSELSDPNRDGYRC
jgi:hypothetical protein